MLASARTADESARHRRPASTPSLGRDSALLQLAGPLRGERVLIIGAGALELLCAALHRGATKASLIRQGTSPEERSADLVIVTEAENPARARDAIFRADRALAGSGRIILHIGLDPAQHVLNVIVQTLRMRGFPAVRLRHIGNHAVVIGSASAAASFSCARRGVGS